MVHQRPIGVLFTVGVGVGLLVGALTLHQVLATTVRNRLHEFATLKAIGHPRFTLFAIVLAEALMLALLSYVPALLASIPLHRWIAGLAEIPMEMTLARALFVLVMTLAMALASVLGAERLLQRAQPAELFR